MGVSQVKKIIDMHHVLKQNLIQKMCDKILKTHWHIQNV
jgi:hypothetical protein